MATQTRTAPAYAASSGPVVFHRQNSLHSSKKPWQKRRRPSFKSNKYRGPEPEEERLSRETSRRTTQSTSRTPKWWKIRLFRGMIEDVKRRAPYYWSDWKDAWDYRVVPATVYMYFAKYGNTTTPFNLPHRSEPSQIFPAADRPQCQICSCGTSLDTNSKA